MMQAIGIRSAVAGDIPALTDLIDRSVRVLGSRDYDEAQIEAALRHLVGVDSQLITDGTYYVAEIAGEIAGCGGWSRRNQIYGSDRTELGAEARQYLDPRTEPAKVRAFFVHPRWERRGVGRHLLQTCEAAAARAGFRALELLATLTGVPLYTACGFVQVEPQEVPLPGGVAFPAVRMIKALGSSAGAAATASPRAA